MMSVCSSCGNDLSLDAKSCSHCSQIKFLQQNRAEGFLTQVKCEKCTYVNPKNSMQCQMCQHLFEQKIVPEQKSQSEFLIACNNCKFQNHMSNQSCLNCLQQLFQTVKKKCKYCGELIIECIFDEHLIECRQQKQREQLRREQLRRQKTTQNFQNHPISFKNNNFNPLLRNVFNQRMPQKRQIFSYDSQMNQYSYCDKKLYNKQQKQIHNFECQDRQQTIDKLSDPNKRLTPLQIQTLVYMNDLAAREHKKVKRDLQLRIMRIGYKNQDLQNLQFYIQNYAPIIIQIHVSKHMKFFITDTHYRNQFQTNMSSGSLSRATRSGWQNSMFDNKYQKATDFQRVKYGVINFSNDPKGVYTASGYGPSYFLLKNHVRERCTFTQKNIKSKDAGTIKFCLKMLTRMNDQQFRAAFSASRALEVPSNICPKYTQVQIHGPIQFSKDIQRIYVSSKQVKGNQKLLDMVYQFSKIHKVEYDFI